MPCLSTIIRCRWHVAWLDRVLREYQDDAPHPGPAMEQEKAEAASRLAELDALLLELAREQERAVAEAWKVLGQRVSE